MIRHVYVSDIEPSPLSLRPVAGVPLNLELRFFQMSGGSLVRYDLSTAYPQVVLTSRTNRNVSANDLTVTEALLGEAETTLPGSMFGEINGYNLEVYLRNSDGNPTALVAKGSAIPIWGAYQTGGPLGPMTVPVVEGPPGPTGPAGPVGPTGSRGSIWFTGTGDPTLTSGVQVGDMYLNNANGDVWRYDGTTWTVT